MIIISLKVSFDNTNAVYTILLKIQKQGWYSHNLLQQSFDVLKGKVILVTGKLGVISHNHSVDRNSSPIMI
jgi:hypothetical protein